MNALLRTYFVSTVAAGLLGCQRPSEAPAIALPSPPQSREATVVSASTAPGTLPARFQLSFSPFARADTFLLDTQTGRVWQLTKFTSLKGDPIAFDEVAVIDETRSAGIPLDEFKSQYESKTKAVTAEPDFIPLEVRKQGKK